MRRSVAARLGQLSDEQLSSPWPGRLLELAGIICIVMWPQLAGVRVWWMHWGFSPALFIAGLSWMCTQRICSHRMSAAGTGSSSGC
jgi:hypothetical protein